MSLEVLDHPHSFWVVKEENLLGMAVVVVVEAKGEGKVRQKQYDQNGAWESEPERLNIGVASVLPWISPFLLPQQPISFLGLLTFSSGRGVPFFLFPEPPFAWEESGGIQGD